MEIVVSDSGGGIPPEILSKIFDPFFTTKDPGKGTGLGLAICRTIMNDQGGEITCESKAGHGATFRIFLPLDKIEEKQA